MNFHAGSLVRARGREWVVLPGSEGDLLKLRPFGGSGEDTTMLYASLELESPKSALFPPPDPRWAGSHDGARLLRDASVLKLRTGAGPFRSLGNVAVEPRAYQLVPLMMALKQKVTRVLIADDVGVGKTIEAGLIVRELLDRGEIARCAVLCPPHLVDQWVGELQDRFNIGAEGLTASNAARLERSVPHGALFDHYPFMVVSLDYIKTDRHRDNFLHMAPECVVVDEAHTCTLRGREQQLRFELLQKLAGDETRHLLLLTATPHSGDDDAFYNLLSLLNRDFLALKEAGANRQKLRERLARYFVQRRRKDIEEWRDQNFFPTRMTAEQTYRLSGAWERFFENVRRYCASLAVRAEEGQGAPLVWFAVLALLRCVSSSPAAAEKALTTKLEGLSVDEGGGEGELPLFDGEPDALALSDLEPPAGFEGGEEDKRRLQRLIREARSLKGMKDPKFTALAEHLRRLLEEGFRPVVFCRYIATANYVADLLRPLFQGVEIRAVTGELQAEERMERVAELAENTARILVATDCLSEGINLQDYFNAVVHYDLAWNPTRHEQREGRIDRFGQKAREVRCSMIYGENNPVDGLILKVILRKAETIRRELGILVPLPDDGDRVQQALVRAAILKGLGEQDKKEGKKGKEGAEQLTFDFGEETPELLQVEEQWQNAVEKMRSNRTIFAQRSLSPEDVLPEWRREQQVLGAPEDVERFVCRALARLGAPLEDKGADGVRRLSTVGLPRSLVERLEAHRVRSGCLIDFRNPPAPDSVQVHRSHPIATLLADELLEGALGGEPGKRELAARCAVTVTRDVERVTRVYVLRHRHQLTAMRRGKTHVMMAEETVTLAFEGVHPPRELPPERASRLLEVVPSANAGESRIRRSLEEALEFWEAVRDRVEAIAVLRAETLREDHVRLKDAANDSGRYEVSACLPVDLLGAYVLLPDEEAL